MLETLHQAMEKVDDYDRLVEEMSKKVQTIINLQADIKSLSKERETLVEANTLIPVFLKVLKKNYSPSRIERIYYEATRKHESN